MDGESHGEVPEGRHNRALGGSALAPVGKRRLPVEAHH